MNKEIYDNLDKYLSMDEKTFEETITSKAFKMLKEEREGKVYTTALLALTNVCKNDCLYCGMGKSNKTLHRFTLKEEEVMKTLDMVADTQLKRIFFIGGENPTIKIDTYIKYIKAAKERGLETNLAMGVFNKEEYIQLKEAGLDIYTIKFESSNPQIFNYSNPDISFEDRMSAIYQVKEAGLKLGSGSIVGLSGQTKEDLIKDIRLTADLDVEWVPIVPYLPAKGTKMADSTPPGDINLTLRAIALLRLLLPEARITASQPKKDSLLGFGDPEGNLEGLRHGADTMFVEVTPFALRNQFAITDHRKLPRIEEIEKHIKPLHLHIV